MKISAVRIYPPMDGLPYWVVSITESALGKAPIHHRFETLGEALDYIYNIYDESLEN